MSRAESKGVDGKSDTVLPFLPDFPLSVSHSEVQSEQRADIWVSADTP